jgi:hypothetical protein
MAVLLTQLTGEHVDALPLVELAIRGPCRRRPLTLGYVAPDVGRVQHAANVAARGGEVDELGNRFGLSRFGGGSAVRRRLGRGCRRRRRRAGRRPLSAATCKHTCGEAERDEADSKRYGATIPPELSRVASSKFSAAQCAVLIFDVHRSLIGAPGSRSSVGERPPHTRKVAGSIPAGTTPKTPVQGVISRARLQIGKNFEGVIGPNFGLFGRAVVERVQCRGDDVEFVVVEIGVDVGGHGDRGMAHRLLQQPNVRAGPPARRASEA